MKPKYRVDGDSFVIENYNHAAPFSSFFPGLAGETGKPMWVFYTNRAQGIASFGVNNKDGAMMEFLPANKAYQATPLLGFRTFVRGDKKSADWYEPFSIGNKDVQQTLIVRPYDIEIIETNKKLGLEFSVLMFGIPNESAPVLGRALLVKNISSKSQSVKVIDGLPRVVPWGMGDFLVKNMSRTIEAFAEVANDHETVPYFKLKVEPDDRPDVRPLNAGFFSFTMNGKNDFSPIIVDPHVVFGHDSSFLKPASYFGTNGSSLDNQLTSNIMPSSFSYSTVSLKGKETKTRYSYYGYTDNIELAKGYASRVQSNPNYFEAKREENQSIYKNLVQRFGFKSANPTLNAYALNTFMDNVLRGGYPLSLSPSGPIVHVYSRKHGDMERDYNAFQISATYFSQGNGNFRDVNQNRRHDILLNPKTESVNVEFFFNLLQLDGYNPLVINPMKFSVPKEVSHMSGFKSSDEFKLACQRLRREPVLPGQIYEFVLKFASDPLNVSNIFRDLIRKCEPVQGIQHGEGFWIDHWTYNLDHLDSYLSIFPEKKKELFFEKEDFTFHDSAYHVRTRKEKYIITKEGKFRQYHAVVLNPEKEAMIEERKKDRQKVRLNHGQGNVLKTTLFTKLFSLAIVKASSLDPFGMGIEMDADKPGWCDALNGGPGLFGSSTHELFELHRLVSLLMNDVLPASPNKTVNIPSEIHSFQRDVNAALANVSAKDFRPTWDKLASAREHFREKTLMGVSGKTRPIKIADVELVLKRILKALEEAEKKVIDPKTKLPTSYYTYDINAPQMPGDWRTHMYKIPWIQHRVAPFLEGSVHAMKAWPEAKSRKLYAAVRKSELIDKKLSMYRLNANLGNESPEIGRIRIFSGGWLENESIFLHMHYKYLLEILRSGLTDEFFKEMKAGGLVPFRDMETYGRPIFENSSFIASSIFPQKEVHGRGFVARLSGATSEFLSMVYFLMFGAKMFEMQDENVIFSPKPQLPGDWFTKKDEISYPKNSLSITVFGVPLTFINDKRKNTFGVGGVQPVGYEWILDGRFYRHDGPSLTPEASLALREGRLEKLTIFLDKPSKK